MHTTRSTIETLADLDVECTHCGVRMATHTGGGGTIRYFHCPSCARWTSSMYAEVFRADAKMRTRKPEQTPRAGCGPVKERIDAWLKTLTVEEPYRTLGVSPSVSDEALRQQYLSLARQHHPDRGGNADQMRRINQAYETVLSQREERRLVPSSRQALGFSR